MNKRNSVFFRVGKDFQVTYGLLIIERYTTMTIVFHRVAIKTSNCVTSIINNLCIINTFASVFNRANPSSWKEAINQMQMKKNSCKM